MNSPAPNGRSASLPKRRSSVPTTDLFEGATSAATLISRAYDDLLEAASILEEGELHVTILRALRCVKMVDDHLTRNAGVPQGPRVRNGVRPPKAARQNA